MDEPSSQHQDLAPQTQHEATYTETRLQQQPTQSQCGPQPEPQAFPSRSTIEITRRNDLSPLYHILRTIIKPLRPKLASAGQTQPGGSIRLNPPKKGDLEFIEAQVESVWQYTYRTKASAASASTRRTNGGPSSAKKRVVHRIFYFHGGGFQMRPSNQHRVFLRQLCRHLYTRTHVDGSGKDSTNVDKKGPKQDQDQDRVEPLITLVSYPLAPHSPAYESLPILQKWLAATLDDAARCGDKVSLMGDSSGGNLALSLGFWASMNYHCRYSPSSRLQLAGDQGMANDGAAEEEEDEKKNSSPQKCPLVSIIVISPAVDLRNVNPDIQRVDRLDPVLTAELTGKVGRIWAGAGTEAAAARSKKSDGSSSSSSSTPEEPTPSSPSEAHSPNLQSTSNQHLSPLLHSDEAFQTLARRDIDVHGVIGTRDVLAPDAELFMRKCERNRVRGKWLVWDGQMHCFPLTAGQGLVGVREGREGLKWLEDVILGD